MTASSRREALVELAKRCEAASGADRELDCIISVAVGYLELRPEKYPGAGERYIRVEGSMETWPGNAPDALVPRYTASLDAAVSLVPEGRAWLASHSFGYGAYADTWDSNGVGPERCIAATPALALTAACLRAIAATGAAS